MSWRIYTLSDPVEPDHMRYVGKTEKPVEKRYKDHIYNAKGRKINRHLYHWIQYILSNGRVPVLAVVESGEDSDGWVAAERRWIFYYLLTGHKLTNGTIGGEGISGHKHSAETIARVVRANKIVQPPLFIGEKLKELLLLRRDGISIKRLMAKFGRSKQTIVSATRLFMRTGICDAMTSSECEEARSAIARIRELRAEKALAVRAEKINRKILPPRPKKPISIETRAKMSKSGKARRLDLDTRQHRAQIRELALVAILYRLASDGIFRGDYVTTGTIARHLGMSRRKVFAWVAKGLIPAIRVGHTWQISCGEILAKLKLDAA